MEMLMKVENIEDEESKSSKPANGWFRSMFSSSRDDRLREAIEEYIEESDSDVQSGDLSSKQERYLISNIFKLRDFRATDVMIPRADIAGIELDSDKDVLLKTFSTTQYGRLIVYKETLDNVVGFIHVKDVFQKVIEGEDFSIKDLVKEIPIVSPALPVMELLLFMQQSKRHIGLVIDEFGGTDGLVTIGDVMEAIVGDMDDEYDQSEQPSLVYVKERSCYYCDARYDIDDFLKELNIELPEDDKDEIDTVGGLLFYYTGRVPLRGEILKLEEVGLKFEIVDADPRRVYKLKISKF